MATLSSAIVKQQVASMHDVEEALARQVLYGGDLATNLLESATLSEARLTEVLAQCLGTPAAPAGRLETPNPSTLRLVPADLAIRHGMYPLGERPGELWLAVAEPIPAEVENDLSFALGVNVVQKAALLVRVREAIARDYGAPLERRLERLLAKLDGTAPPPSAGDPRLVRRAPSGTLGLPRPDTLPPQAYPPAPPLTTPRPPAFDPGLLRSGLAPEVPAIVPLAMLNVTAASPTAEPGAPSPDADATAARAAPGTSESTSPPLRSEPPPPLPADEGATFPAVAPLPPAPPPAHRTQPSLQVPPSVRPRPGASARPAPSLATPSGAPGSRSPRARRGPYTAAMAEADLEQATSRDEIVRACFDFCAQYFEYTALFAVQGDQAEGREAQGPGADRAELSRVTVPLDAPSVLAAAVRAGSWVLAPLAPDGLDAALGAALRRPLGTPLFVVPVVLRDRSVLLLWGDHGDEGVELSAVGEVISIVALTTAALERLILQRKRSARRAVAVRDALEGMPSPLVQRASAPPRLPAAVARAQALTSALTTSSSPAPAPDAAPATTPPPDAPVAGPPPSGNQLAPPPPVVEIAPRDLHDALTPAVPATIRASWTEPSASGLAMRHQTIPGVAPRHGSTPEPRAVLTGDAPEISVEAAEIDASWGIEDEVETGVPLAAASRSVHFEPAPLRRRQSSKELRLPSVIVDVESDARLLVERLITGNTAALEQLLDLGDSAITALVAVFPGPITAEPRAGARETMQPSRAGPVLDALARIGRPTVPYLLVRSADADAMVRSWTVRLLGELRGRDAARTIARRFADEDERVRQASLAAARLLQKDPESRDALREYLNAAARDAPGVVGNRHAAIEGLGRVGDVLAVPSLIELLGDARPDIIKSAAWALVALTLQDFGTDPWAWQRWWELHAKHHRIEWLIDALTHDSQEIRHAAGDELKTATREYFGYYDDLPRRERARAQERYREWWETRGRAIFA